MKGEGLLMFLAGAAVGTVLTMLYAPMSGHDTRGKLKSFLEKELDDKFCHCGEHAHEKGVMDE
ncbi:MAG: YtxH domain-containing protein [Tidjanibacter sp.]|nr:YtxH domain-containing protein [Tidjanibacter sp.]